MASSLKAITQFRFLDAENTALSVDVIGTINSGARTVALTVPFGTVVTALVPDIQISPLATITPADGVARNFTSPVTYTIKAENGTTNVWTVTVTIALNPAKDIVRFTILGVDGIISRTDISVEVPYRTDVKKLTPTIVITGASVSPASGVERDFSNPERYIVTAQNGSTKEYIVTVIVAEWSGAGLNPVSFSVSPNITEAQAQKYMDLFVSYLGKKPKKEHEAIVYELCGGRANFLEIQKVISQGQKDIVKIYKDMKPKKVKDNLPDDPEQIIAIGNINGI